MSPTDSGLRALAISGAPVVGLDLGATHVRIAIAAGDVAVVHSYRTAELTMSADEGIVPALVDVVRAEIEAHDRAPGAIGVGVAAYVDRAGVLLQWRPFGLPAGPALRDRLADATGLPVLVDNDANLAAVAEVEAGAARGLSDVAVITLGTNVGLGIVAGGRLLRGAHGAAGEAGNLLVPARRGRRGRDPEADAGRLGHGRTDAPDHYALLEELVGGGALLRSALASERGTELPSPALGTVPGRSEGIFAMAAAGNRRAAAAVRHGIEGWAMLIADLSAILDPEAVVLSGGLIEEAPRFIEPLRNRVGELTPLPPDIRVGELGAQAGLAGAVIVARSALSSGVLDAATSVASGVQVPGRPGGRTPSRGEVGA